MSKLSVLLLFGGESTEHDVSIASARYIDRAIDREKYTVTLCYIPRSGKDWKIVNSFEDSDTPQESVSISPGRRAFKSCEREHLFDVAFPVLHGKNGEDGTIQGLLETMHLPYVGCGVESSALCMDKHRAKLVLRSYDTPVVDWTTLKKGETSKIDLFEQLDSEVLFVKPSRSGSSIGVSRVDTAEDLEKAIALAHQYDSIAIIEPAIVGREIEVGVLEKTEGTSISTIGEIVPTDHFYSYSEKYSPDSTSRMVLEAQIDPEVKAEIERLTHKVFEVLGCKGLARIDLFLTAGNTLYINEVNTMPGFTDSSMFPKLWEQIGIKQSELLDNLIQNALRG